LREGGKMGVGYGGMEIAQDRPQNESVLTSRAQNQKSEAGMVMSEDATSEAERNEYQSQPDMLKSHDKNPRCYG
jgi:hypothetical protein